MARLDTRAIAESIPEDWLSGDDSATAPEWSETAETREWQMIVAFLQNC